MLGDERFHDGSSPRMRGAPKPDRKIDVEPRIIPADAGSTAVLRVAILVYLDHPRGCGEHKQPQPQPR